MYFKENDFFLQFHRINGKIFLIPFIINGSRCAANNVSRIAQVRSAWLAAILPSDSGFGCWLKTMGVIANL
jgi:hypothetical protein